MCLGRMIAPVTNADVRYCALMRTRQRHKVLPYDATQPKQCRSSNGRPQDVPECGFSHSRKDWLQEHMDNPTVLVKQFPKHLLHMFQRYLRTNLEGNTRLHQRSSKIIEGFFVGCALIAGAGPRGNHTRQLKPKNSQTAQQQINSTPDTQCTSHILALMVPNHTFKSQERG